MTQRHKHADCIIAWANGAQIQSLRPNGQWVDNDFPLWVSDIEYRIKSEPKPDYTLVCSLRAYGDQKGPVPNRYHYGDVLCTFDGETNKIKAVEMFK